MNGLDWMPNQRPEELRLVDAAMMPVGTMRRPTLYSLPCVWLDIGRSYIKPKAFGCIPVTLILTLIFKHIFCGNHVIGDGATGILPRQVHVEGTDNCDL